MIKKIIKDGYSVEIEEAGNANEETIRKYVDRAIKFMKARDAKEDRRLVNAEGKIVEAGDEVTDFRGEKAIVVGWELPKSPASTGRVVVKRGGENGYTQGYYPSVFGLKWVEKSEPEDVKIEDKLSEEELASIIGSAMVIKKNHPEWTDKEIESRLFEILDIGHAAYSQKELDEISEKVILALEQSRKILDKKVEDVPVNSPEEEIKITYNEPVKGGKAALTSGMVEEAFKQRGKDDGKTFEAYVDVVIDSLKEDIANAKYIVSGEMTGVRKFLLEDYVKIEKLVQKAGLTDKLNEMRPLIDELSEKLDLNYWKKPKFKPQERKSLARELRNKHRFDSRIEKTVKPVFLCSESDLLKSYNDAKAGKLPQVFEGNLIKVEKDMTADYDRINQGLDHYLDDPRIRPHLPAIVKYYEKAKGLAEDLGYNEFAERFGIMLETIKKGWGLE